MVEYHVYYLNRFGIDFVQIAIRLSTPFYFICRFDFVLACKSEVSVKRTALSLMSIAPLSTPERISISVELNSIFAFRFFCYYFANSILSLLFEPAVTTCKTTDDFFFRLHLPFLLCVIPTWRIQFLSTHFNWIDISTYVSLANCFRPPLSRRFI